MKKKPCTKCGVQKELKEFYKQNRLKGGVNAECKECYKNRSRSKRSLDREWIKMIIG